MRYAAKAFPGAVKEIREHFKQCAAQAEPLKNDYSLEMDVAYLGEVTKDNWTGDNFKITLRNTETGKEMTLASYSTGTGHRKVNLTGDKMPRKSFLVSVHDADLLQNNTYVVPPSPLSVLGCIRSDDTRGESFDEWCRDIGYDTDSRKALEIYLACQKQTCDFRFAFPGFDLDEYEPLEDY